MNPVNVFCVQMPGLTFFFICMDGVESAWMFFMYRLHSYMYFFLFIKLLMMEIETL